jgi:microsomal dipeptidase-like Zn-dependent dipeptidase
MREPIGGAKAGPRLSCFSSLAAALVGALLLSACGAGGGGGAASLKAPAAAAAVAITHCGAVGERACCWLERTPDAPCDQDLVQAGTCTVDCLCKGGLASSIGMCVALPCGGKGQRACCGGERDHPCNKGLTEIPGCSGDCSCPTLAGRASGMCSVMEEIPEPETGQISAEASSCSMRGYADIHLHLFGDLAHGGGVLAGRPYDEAGGINVALGNDFGTGADLVDNLGRSPPRTDAIPYLCPGFLPGCGPTLWHGNHDLIADSAGAGTKDGSASNLGAPLFNGWPTWTSTTHQQAYYKWLERAWRGGLRLTVVLAVQNEALCRLSNHQRSVDCSDSMAGIDLQLDEARRFEAFIDGQSGGAGLGWFRIVESPAEARRVIRAGKLAVVLGIEVDNLFGCRQGGSCTAESVASAIAAYRARGVRHVFPIHNFDNAFGGTATWQDAINVGNAASEQAWWSTENCAAEGYGFWLDAFGEGALVGVATLLKGVVFPGLPPAYPSGLGGGQASCNTRGLTPLGQALVGALMQAKMVIDVDHMSRRSVADTLALAAARGYPLVASHVQPFDLHQQTFAANAGRHERMRTTAQLAALRASGGLMGAMLKDDVQDTDLKGRRWTVPYGAIADDCRHSSKSFAQAYQFAVDQMGGAVPFGSDFNGIAGHLGPRFGSEACGGDGGERAVQAAAGDQLEYPFTLPGFGSFDRQVTGQKTFDFNFDGLAHVGLLPDLVADLTRLGLPTAYLDSIYRSAEAYVELWERVEGSGGGTPASGGGAGGGAGCVDREVVADASCTANASVASDALRADASFTLVQSPPGPYGVGTTRVALTATSSDACVAPISCTGTVTVRDLGPPAIAAVTARPARLEAEEGDREGESRGDGKSESKGGESGEREEKGEPGHGMQQALRPVTVTVAASDGCDPSPPACLIIGVTSSQPPRRAGRPDWIITGPLTVALRAEVSHRGDDHEGGGHGEGGHAVRTYTIEVECADASRNASRGSTTVTVIGD